MMTNDIIRKKRVLQFAVVALATLGALPALAQTTSSNVPELPEGTASVDASVAAQPSPAPSQFLLTRSGVLWEGAVVDKGNAYSVGLPGGGAITVSKLDVLFIGDTRESVFAYKVSATRMEDVNEVLKLADWAGRRQLGAEAIRVLSERLERAVDAGERHALEKKLADLAEAENFRANAARAVAQREDRRRAESEEAAQNAQKVAGSDDASLDAWGRTLAPAALERFSRKALPVLQKRCATSGCHDSGTPGARYVVPDKAFGAAQRLALLKTLRETIVYVDFEDLEASPILSHPTVTNARGDRVYPFGADRYSARDCANFVDWLESAKGDAALAKAAREIRASRADVPALRPGAASRYDVDARSVSGGDAASSATPDQGFAGLFDPAEPSTNVGDAPVFRQGLPQESAQFMPSPFDDVNSTESRLSRVGALPRKSYRDDYDPAIFNDRYHPATTPARTAAPQPATPAPIAGEPTGTVDVLAPGGRL